MKANEMPKKIYIFDYNDAMVTPIKGDTVYVREDTFIEKACEWLEIHTFSELNLDFGHSLQIKEFVDRFKEHMEGE